MSWLTLSGWAQPAESLLTHFPHARAENYAAHENIDAWLAALSAQNLSVDILVGWSLGGYLAVEALRRNALQAKALVLISTPIQFVRNEMFLDAMPVPTWQQFKKNYTDDALRTAKRFSALMSMGDAAAQQVSARMPSAESMADKARFEHWLHVLETASHLPHVLDHLPPTLVIHGAQDAIVPAAQAVTWQKKLPKTRILILPQAGHAPHWHDEAHVLEQVHRFTKEHVNA